MLAREPGTSHILGKCSTTELPPSGHFSPPGKAGSRLVPGSSPQKWAGLVAPSRCIFLVSPREESFPFTEKMPWSAELKVVGKVV